MGLQDAILYAKTPSRLRSQVRGLFAALPKKTHPKACATLAHDGECPVTYNEFMKEHWVHLRTMLKYGMRG
jgi:hypothetical protein